MCLIICVKGGAEEGAEWKFLFVVLSSADGKKKKKRQYLKIRIANLLLCRIFSSRLSIPKAAKITDLGTLCWNWWRRLKWSGAMAAAGVYGNDHQTYRRPIWTVVHIALSLFFFFFSFARPWNRSTLLFPKWHEEEEDGRYRLEFLFCFFIADVNRSICIIIRSVPPPFCFLRRNFQVFSAPTGSILTRTRQQQKEKLLLLHLRNRIPIIIIICVAHARQLSGRTVIDDDDGGLSFLRRHRSTRYDFSLERERDNLKKLISRRRKSLAQDNN